MATVTVSKDWFPKEGDEVVPGSGEVLGKNMGAGFMAQNNLYDIVDMDGQTTGKVIKISKASNRPARQALVHEWETIVALNKCEERRPEIGHSYITGEAVVMREGDKLPIAIIMEMSGPSVSAKIKRPDFRDVSYIISMLHQVLVALDVAHAELGFEHYDLKLPNIMELHPDRTRTMNSPSFLQNACFVLIDFGTADFQLRGQDGRRMSRKGVAAELASRGYKLPEKLPGSIKLHQHYWRRKGDVYRLMMELGKHLQHRTWAEEDRVLVEQLLELVADCTGERVIAHFAPRAALDAGEIAPIEVAADKRSSRMPAWLLRGKIDCMSPSRAGTKGMSISKALSYPVFKEWREGKHMGRARAAADAHMQILSDNAAAKLKRQHQQEYVAGNHFTGAPTV